MAKKKYGRLPAIRIAGAGAKSLYISTAASRYLLGHSEVNVYEKGSVMAIEGALEGSYHLSYEKGRERSVISSTELICHIVKKYGCDGGLILPVWEGCREGVFFFGKTMPTEETPPMLDETWSQLETEYNRRAGEWIYVHDNWIEFTKGIRERLPSRLQAYQAGTLTVLKPEPDGPLVVTSRRQNGTRMLDEPMLARYLRETYNGQALGLRLNARRTRDGLVLIGTEESELAKFRPRRMKPIDMDATMLRFATLHKKGSLYLSAKAYQAMGSCDRISAYCHENWIALKADSTGDKQVLTCGYVKEIFSARLRDFLQQHYPEQRKFYLVRHGGLWLLQTEPDIEAILPYPKCFHKLELTLRGQGRIEPRKSALPQGSRTHYQKSEVRI